MLPITTTNSSWPTLKNVLSEFLPSDVISIVDGYHAHADAIDVLVLGTDGQPLDSESNRTTIAAIKLALTTASCDREIIRLIFQHAADNGYTGFLNRVLNELRAQKTPIILDNVNFSGINLSTLRLDEVSLKNANFAQANLDAVSFIAADLTGMRGMASATGRIRMNYQTRLHNTELEVTSEIMSPNGPDGKPHHDPFIKPFEIELLKPISNAHLKLWTETGGVVLQYSVLIHLSSR